MDNRIHHYEKSNSKRMGDKIKTENYKKSVVNIKKKFVLIKGNPFTFSILKNKICYELLLNEKFKKPIGFNTWNTYLQQELPKCETVCYFIFNYLIKRKQVEGLQMEIITFLYSYQKNYL